MSSLHGYAFTLQRLLAELRQQKTELIAAPGRARPDEGDYTQLSRKLQAWVDRLRPLARELRNREQFQALRQRQLHQVPRHARYSEQQSIRGKLDDIEAVWALVRDVLAELQEIDRRRHGPYSVHDAVRGAEDIARDWAERSDQIADLVRSMGAPGDGPEFIPARNFDKTLAPGDLANLVVTGVMLLAWLVKRLGRR